MSPTERTAVVKQAAAELGFDRAGVAEIAPVARADFVARWLAAGHAGQMHYLGRTDRTDPGTLLDGARSALVLACNYHQPPPSPDPPHDVRGRVAMYAWGDDYHEVVRNKLWRLIARMREVLNEPFEARPCVDTAPIIERELAAAAGIGWIGKNTMVLHQDLGSYFFLAEVVTTLELIPDTPAPDHCGSCRRCLDACPTAAFPEPYAMDASRCISYLTIELRDEVPAARRGAIGSWVFGCDVCQEVCPYNQDAPVTAEPRFTARRDTPRPSLHALLDESGDAIRALRRRSAVRRAKPEMLRRNAKIALDNAKGPSDTG